MAATVSNTTRLRAIYDAYGKGDADALYEAIDPDEFHMVEHSHSTATPWGGPWEGRSGMQDFIATVREHMTHSAYVCEDMVDAGDDLVISWGKFVTMGKRSTKPVEQPWVHKVRFRGGNIISIEEFYDSLAVAEALHDRKF